MFQTILANSKNAGLFLLTENKEKEMIRKIVERREKQCTYCQQFLTQDLTDKNTDLKIF